MPKFLLTLLACLLLSQAYGATLQVRAGPVLVATGVRLADFEGSSRELALKSLSREIYTQYRDQADFLVLIANRRVIPTQTGVEGYHYRVSNQVRGLGVPLFNAGADFGGTKQLQGILYFPRWTAFWRMPLLHELAHQWANDAWPSTEPGHFGFCGSGSQLGGFDPKTLQARGSGVYQARNYAGRTFGTAANGANTIPYSPFELYLMGLADGGEVAPFPCAVQPKWINMRQGLFSARGMPMVSLNDVTRRNGLRVPTYKTSPKVFKLLVVLLSEGQPTATDLRGLQQLTQRMVQTGDNGDSSYSFFEATRGRGRLELVYPLRR